MSCLPSLSRASRKQARPPARNRRLFVRGFLLFLLVLSLVLLCWRQGWFFDTPAKIQSRAVRLNSAEYRARAIMPDVFPLIHGIHTAPESRVSDYVKHRFLPSPCSYRGLVLADGMWIVDALGGIPPDKWADAVKSGRLGLHEVSWMLSRPHNIPPSALLALADAGYFHPSQEARKELCEGKGVVVVLDVGLTVDEAVALRHSLDTLHNYPALRPVFRSAQTAPSDAIWKPVPDHSTNSYTLDIAAYAATDQLLAPLAVISSLPPNCAFQKLLPVIHSPTDLEKVAGRSYDSNAARWRAAFYAAERWLIAWRERESLIRAAMVIDDSIDWYSHTPTSNGEHIFRGSKPAPGGVGSIEVVRFLARHSSSDGKPHSSDIIGSRTHFIWTAHTAVGSPGSAAGYCASLSRCIFDDGTVYESQEMHDAAWADFGQENPPFRASFAGNDTAAAIATKEGFVYAAPNAYVLAAEIPSGNYFNSLLSALDKAVRSPNM